MAAQNVIQHIETPDASGAQRAPAEDGLRGQDMAGHEAWENQMRDAHPEGGEGATEQPVEVDVSSLPLFHEVQQRVCHCGLCQLTSKDCCHALMFLQLRVCVCVCLTWSALAE